MNVENERAQSAGTAYALFLGCYIPTRVPSMEKSARVILSRLGTELIDIENASCCPDPIVVRGVDHGAWLALAARNLSLAEEMDLDLLTLCSGCFETLKTANVILSESPGIKKEVNALLARIGREFKGKVQVKSLLDVLVGEKNGKLKKMIEHPLGGLRVAVHYGCHLLRPSEVLNTDDPFNPTVLDEIVEGVVGAKSLRYRRKMWCCGAGARVGDPDLSLEVAREKLKHISSAGAQCIALLCPFCQVQFDLGQLMIKRKFREDYGIPVLSIPQLIGLAMQIDPDQLGLNLHRTSTKPFLDAMGLEVQ